jgi:hypothetical protein
MPRRQRPASRPGAPGARQAGWQYGCRGVKTPYGLGVLTVTSQGIRLRHLQSFADPSLVALFAGR